MGGRSAGPPTYPPSSRNPRRKPPPLFFPLGDDLPEEKDMTLALGTLADIHLNTVAVAQKARKGFS